ncbi:hypothetical protein GCM10007047_20820 [Cerasicoccus arenae]|uniref:Uncharacterized protein n=1 Tax=Cerasicoccus arenae TaxID=424488 RepID=A0A8J3GEH8_9BACT|nr:hypothetical protein GCM10007047_20820 [Cerasicoccus arenae]
MALGENVLDEPQTMPQIKALGEKYPDWEICILHEDNTGDDTSWILMTEEVVEGERNPFRPAGPIQIMQEQVAEQKANLTDTHRIIEILREFIQFNEMYDSRKAELEERERYMQESEEALMHKAQELEELRVELEQKQENKQKQDARQKNMARSA